MHYSNLFDYGRYGFGAGWVLVAVLAIWEVIWKGYGLWKAARNGHTGWFVAILIINSLGILPLLYIYVFGPKQEKQLRQS